jgi:hypothetical protein
MAMRRMLVLITVVVLLAAVTAPALGAPPGDEEVYTLETVYDEVPGRLWQTGGGVLHERGLISDTTIEGHELFRGTGSFDINYNLNLATWTGNLWGSFIYYSAEYPGSGWAGTWYAQWTGVGTWEGSGVGRGYGDFAGMVLRFDVDNTTEGADAAITGYVFTQDAGSQR